MGMDYERKSCRLDRRRNRRGSKKSQKKTKSNKQLQRIVRNEDLRLRSLHRRSCQDVKRDRFLPEKCAEEDEYRYPRGHSALVVNKFKDDDFFGGVLPRWDRDSGAPREDAYLFIPNDDEMFKTYSVPDFAIEFYFPEDGLWFGQDILKTIAEYIPSFGFRCFKRSREEMNGGIISHGSHSPSVFHYAGIFKREQTFVYNFPTNETWDTVICLGNHETRQTAPMLRERHFHVEPIQGQMTISNANILFKFDIGQDEIRAGRTIDWCSVTAFITEANLVLIVYSCSKQQFYSLGGQEHWCWLGDGVYQVLGNSEFRSVQEVYAYDLDVFLELYLQADDLYDMRFQKHCVFARKLTNRLSYAPVA